MKKVNLLIAVMFLLLVSESIKAQTQTSSDFFSGKWNILTKGTPDGDRKMIISFEKRDNKMTGIILDSIGAEMFQVNSLEFKENQVTVYFTSQGYDVQLLLIKKDDNHLTGNVMGMFEAEGVRTNEKKQ
jgi:hypothetical protein